MNPPPPCSIIILTQDEEVNIRACLESVALFDDVHLLDSGSTDQTAEIAREMGIAVHTNPFTGFGTQRNWAIDHIETKYPWTLHLDADERMTPELAREIYRELLRNPEVGGVGGVGGYHIAGKLMFGDRWLKYAGGFPTYQVRLFHKDRLRFIDYGHGQREVTTFELGTLKEAYLHLAFGKGLEDWYAKHAEYAKREAEEAVRDMKSGEPIGIADLFRGDKVKRRRAMKRIAYRFPFRSLMRWGYMLMVKRAFLDGWAGIEYTRMMAAYESMTATQIKLLRKQAGNA